MFGFSVGPWELILILAVVLIIFGPGKLPEVGKYLGNGIREFRKAKVSGEGETSKDSIEK
jgi:sec-independent protein translocase protein TatA